MIGRPSQRQTYQPGDVGVTIGGKPHYARLTLGALAELSERLGARGPQALSRVLKMADPEHMDIAMRAVLRPVHGEIEGKLAVSALDRARCFAQLFERAFERDDHG